MPSKSLLTLRTPLPLVTRLLLTAGVATSGAALVARFSGGLLAPGWVLAVVPATVAAVAAPVVTYTRALGRGSPRP